MSIITYEIAREVNWMVRSHFVWTSDKVAHGELEHWADYSDKLLNDPAFIIRDDCDSYGLTAGGILMKKYDIPPEKIKGCAVNTEVGQREGKYLDHFKIEIGGFVIDNRYPQPYQIGWSQDKYVKHCYFNDLLTWYDTEIINNND